MDEDLTLDMNTRPSTPGDVPAVRDAWGRFKLLARVGQGGFGEVYRAWDPDLEREVALKLLLPSPTGSGQSDEEYKAMLREARALASVRHPNIVPVYGIDRHDGRVGFWTDFVKGKTLSALLVSQGPFGYREAVLIGLDVTRALSTVHRSGLLHRDIKAENVMREEGGHILLMDFGLSALPHLQEDIAGTPNYMAPELWQGKTATVASDIYSMGVLLFYLVTGEYPARLGRLSRAEAMAALAQKRTLMDLRSDLPDQFLRAVSRAIETDPAKRFSSAGQLSEALAECIGTAVPVEAEVQRAAEVTTGSRRWMTIAAAILATTFVLAAADYISLHRQKDGAGAKTALAVAGPGINDEYTHASELLKKSYKDSNIAESVTIFQHILKEDNTFALAQAGLGTAYFKQYKNDPSKGDLLDAAKAATEKALGMDKACVPALVTRAQIEAITGHSDLAINDANAALEHDPHSAEAHAALGEVYQSLGKGKEAIEEISQSVALDPDNSMWPLRLGHYYMGAGNLATAAEQWQSSVQLDPQNTLALYDLGLVDIQLDKLEDARKNFQTVLSLQPDAYSYRALGSVFQLQGNYADAAEMDKKAIELNPSDYQAWGSLGSVYRWSGDKREESMETYRKAIELAEVQRRKSPDDSDLLADLADYYASVGNTGMSLPLARKALILAPDDPDISYIAGYSYEMAGERGKAVQLISKAVARGIHKNEFLRSPEFAKLRSDPSFLTELNKARSMLAVDSKTKLN
ncbi:serine/threonine-protein kinase [Granulicella aggregans]|uniref:serine/threonine-protein kinase n=1 Tax=Granulicella aggregans TaxID=474949 RepID=UPI0021DFAB5B|nr:serine/threonine-protein kinase [Granulicella aggregans]